MKKNIAVLLAVLMAVSFTGCSRKNNNSGTVNQSPSPSATAAPTPKPTVTPSPEAESAPESDIADAATLEDFRNAVKKVYGEAYIPSRQLTESEIMNMTGLTEDMYKEVLHLDLHHPQGCLQEHLHRSC